MSSPEGCFDDNAKTATIKVLICSDNSYEVLSDKITYSVTNSDGLVFNRHELSGDLSGNFAGDFNASDAIGGELVGSNVTGTNICFDFNMLDSSAYPMGETLLSSQLTSVYDNDGMEIPTTPVAIDICVLKVDAIITSTFTPSSHNVSVINGCIREGEEYTGQYCVSTSGSSISTPLNHVIRAVETGEEISVSFDETKEITNEQTDSDPDRTSTATLTASVGSVDFDKVDLQIAMTTMVENYRTIKGSVPSSLSFEFRTRYVVDSNFGSQTKTHVAMFTIDFAYTYDPTIDYWKAILHTGC